MRPYVKDEDMKGISVSDEDKKAGSPKAGDMIARNPTNHKDVWLVAKKYFEENLEEILEEAISEEENLAETTPLERVKIELEELKEKMDKAKLAVKKGFVPEKAVPLLEQQLIHMKYYADILTSRIKQWKDS